MQAGYPSAQESRSEKILHVVRIAEKKTKSSRFDLFETPGNRFGGDTRQSGAICPRNRSIPRVRFPGVALQRARPPIRDAQQGAICESLLDKEKTGRTI